jgi:transposase-like protein
MPRKKLDDQIADVAAINNSDARLRGAAKLRRKVLPKKTGRPSQYSEAKAAAILKRIENGETLTAIAKESGISLDCVYGWLKQYPEFAERYQTARESMAKTLLDNLIDEARQTEPERALLLKTKGAIFQWAIARFNPSEFSDSRRIELKGEISHKHSHELSSGQKQRIAESWLMSQQNELPVIEGETIPALESDDVGEICATHQREVPKRKRTAPIQKQRSDELLTDF